MKNYTSIIAALSFIFLLSCSKTDSGGGTPTPNPPPAPAEEKIVFGLDPDPGSTTVASTGNTYAFKVNVTSKIPAAGIKVELTTKKEVDGSTLSEGTKTIDPYTTGSEISIGGLSTGTLYNVSIVVASKGTSSNTETKSFKIARK
jgi:hypothetical protein